MMTPGLLRLLFLLALAALPVPALALATPQETLQNTERLEGLLPVHVDRRGGRVLLSLPAPDAQGIAGRFIYVTALETGLGSASLGLDRALSRGSRLLVFRRIGRRIVAEIENPRFRATGASADEQAGVRRSFAYSTIWMGDIAAETAGRPAAGRHRHLPDPRRHEHRPVAARAGEWRLSPGPRAQRRRHQFRPRLPAQYRARGAADLRQQPARARGRQHRPGRRQCQLRRPPFADRAARARLPAAPLRSARRHVRHARSSTSRAPLGSPIVYELANRFRLERLDPGAPRSRVRNPIVFYIDRAAPEPIRTALLEGVAWWREAFEAAGYIDAFRVEILPEGVDPLDIRYNVVNWVNRATRGWSYGQVIEDPRTGEIIKGQVLLGSLRVRQDMMIFQALVGAGLTGTGDPNDPVTAALARIRQLAAHEVGHALGLAHNFAGSIQGRYSVMDYPAPRVRLVDGALDLTDAYGVGVGRWDRFAVDWLYGAETDAEAAPRMAAALAEGLRFVADDDARPAGAAHPVGSLWDDFADPVAELRRMMAGPRGRGRPASARARSRPASRNRDLRRAFVPIWLIHRYQVEAAAKLLGGVDFAYAVNGDGHGEARIVAPADQRRALDALLDDAVAGRADRAAGAAAAALRRLVGQR